MVCVLVHDLVRDSQSATVFSHVVPGAQVLVCPGPGDLGQFQDGVWAGRLHPPFHQSRRQQECLALLLGVGLLSVTGCVVTSGGHCLCPCL